MKQIIKKPLRKMYYSLSPKYRTLALSTYQQSRIFWNSRRNNLQISTVINEPSVTGELSYLNEFNGVNKLIFLLPVIDWDFRVQRPQHLCMQLAKLGNGVIYFSTTFNITNQPGFTILDSPAKNVICCRLNMNENVNIYRDCLNEDQSTFLAKSLLAVSRAFGKAEVYSILNLPFWHSAVKKLPKNTVVYDCMDHHAGFSTNSFEMLKQENTLLKEADLVITTAELLSKNISEARENVIIRNGAEIDYFKATPSEELLEKSRPVVGYYGAIAEWFDTDLVLKTAKLLPQYDFVLIGNVTTDVSCFKNQSNIKLLGEVPYKDLTKYLVSFDVCIIPFIINDLTLCTNPVKVYEYLAAGKPVVATAMPEVVLIEEKVFIASDAEAFSLSIEKAMETKDDAELVTDRKKWAESHDWLERARHLESEMELLTNGNKAAKVSIVVLTFNNLKLTKDCLESIERNTTYVNFEVIIVDNASTDGSIDYLENFCSRRDNYLFISNEKNLGFAKGNNVGLEKATGDILVVLNNDTYVGPYWLEGLVGALEKNPELGIVGPVTNNIGNEAKINISYGNWVQLNNSAINYIVENRNKLYPVECLAFFCVAIPRSVYESVGPISEDYGLGFFEDDDYCKAVEKAGFKIAVVEDSFVHHHLSASFNKLKSSRKQELMNTNKAIFEKKWGPWKPHKYRKGVN
ncbi:glycosyltransferase [Vibrio cholerae]|uniref:Glycosyltransferase n=5 Tax=Vibrio cholerae TaxID=666 RepID=A0A6B3LH45_VIBCL|nr:glycosyltransferase [Vibrio cholerae]EGQ9966927.1 glycosyltransferase [Vibrio cholerae]EGR0380384.1 glycosyltransferase [Vibrio cholerae]EGR2107141.1 glycosyltransferase [Vibrio cholerae]EHQ2335994.1 glycosyltransferase [Vibrio cholerae]EJL6593762.1 glycosyltransferase [Vibrio cholerae]